MATCSAEPCVGTALEASVEPGRALSCRQGSAELIMLMPMLLRRKIHNPRILLLDCPLEYKKGENQTNVELSREEDWCGPSAPYLQHTQQRRALNEHPAMLSLACCATKQCRLMAVPDTSSCLCAS